MKLSRGKVLGLIVAGVTAALAAITMGWILFPSSPRDVSCERLTVGLFPSMYSTLLYIGEREGYFAKNGLDLTVLNYDSGVSAVKSLLRGDVEIATAAEFVLVNNIFDSPDLRILAAIDSIDEIKVVGRKDRGVDDLNALRGKKIGLMEGSQAEFCLWRLITLQSIPIDEIEVVNLMPSQQPDALKRGEVDAVITWQPNVRRSMEKLEDNGVILPGQSKQDFYWLLICRDTLIKQRPSVIRRFLESLIQSEDFLEEKESEARDTVHKRLGGNRDDLETQWGDHRFEVLLPQPLILAMEDQARWLILRDLTRNKKMPNFLDVVHVHGLKALRPTAVSIIHRETRNDH